MHFHLLCSQELGQLLLKWSLVYEKYAVNAAVEEEKKQFNGVTWRSDGHL